MNNANLNIPNEILQIKSALGDNANLHLVGGCIRDSIMGIKPKDFDLATSLPPETVVKLCDAAGIQTIQTGIRRGTITAVINHEPFEITTFRKKGCETSFSKTIQEDLSARDFTINAIALNLDNGNIVDPFNGIQDIDWFCLRSVGSAEDRFNEDPHRIIRMCRFAAQFEFEILAEEMKAAQKLQERLKTIEAERINAELKKIFELDSNKLLDCLILLDDVGFFKMWIPELEACKGVNQNKYHLYDVYTHTMNVIVGCKFYHSKLAALFHDIGKPGTRSEVDGAIHFYGHEDVGADMAETILRRLKFSNNDINDVVKLIKFHMRPIDCGKKAIRKLKAALGELFPIWLNLKWADKFFGGTPTAELEKFELHWKAFIDNLKIVEDEECLHPTSKLAINGTVVMQLLDLKPGPKLGEWMEKVRDFVYEFPEKNIPKELAEFVIEEHRKSEYYY